MHTSEKKHFRAPLRLIQSIATSDGAGVKLRRSLGQSEAARWDPFLMLDEFYSDQPGDYIAGFPSHPHRGFETVTYMLAGHMLHEDHLGNRGDLWPGDVQWMTAGRGIIHSEMPQQQAGLMRGFQLWLNLPAAQKMQPADYRDIPAAQLPQVSLATGGSFKAIAGQFQVEGQCITGAVKHSAEQGTNPHYADIRLPAGASFEMPLDGAFKGVCYVYDGCVSIGEVTDSINAGVAVLLDEGDHLLIHAQTAAGILLLAAKPIGEPIVQYGPFVMNTTAEIRQAIQDFREGRFTHQA